jgi:hypothetical protein
MFAPADGQQWFVLHIWEISLLCLTSGEQFTNFTDISNLTPTAEQASLYPFYL